jgi:uncharacterized membrane protein
MARTVSILIASLLLLPAGAAAQSFTPPGPIIRDIGDIENLLATAIRWIFTLVVILCVIFILYGSFLYVTAAGDATRVSKANQTLLFAAIGLAVALLAWSIVALVRNFIGGGGGGPGLPPGVINV